MTHWRKNQIKGPSANPPSPACPPFLTHTPLAVNTHNLGALEICLPSGRDARDVCMINWPLVLHGDSSHLSSIAGVF